ncbi:MAG TPA: haloacid dehalogenase [Thermomicrobiales bacterium]|nr:haloacid dehalogenase [Thermomicrobiales bacterium]
MTVDLNAIGDEILARLEATNAARERALAESRQIIRLCANCIRAVHRGEFAAGQQLAAEAGERLTALAAALRDHPAIYWSGYVQDAQKEYAEARLVHGLIGGGGAPGPDALRVGDAVYLNGLGEAAGELRRYALDRLRAGETARAEWALGVMDDIYGLLVTVDFPDAVTGGLRRTTDMVRGVLERTRGDVTIALRQQQLEQALRGMTNDE